jgi:hypothetical protein
VGDLQYPYAGRVNEASVHIILRVAVANGLDAASIVGRLELIVQIFIYIGVYNNR